MFFHGGSLKQYIDESSLHERMHFIDEIIRVYRLVHHPMPVLSRTYLKSFMKKLYRDVFQNQNILIDAGFSSKELANCIKEAEADLYDQPIVRLTGELNTRRIWYTGDEIVGLGDTGLIRFGFVEEDLVKCILTWPDMITPALWRKQLSSDYSSAVIQALLFQSVCEKKDKDSLQHLKSFCEQDTILPSQKKTTISSFIEMPNLVGTATL